MCNVYYIIFSLGRIVIFFCNDKNLEIKTLSSTSSENMCAYIRIIYSSVYTHIYIYYAYYIIIIIHHHRRRRAVVMKTGFCVMTTLSVGPEGNAPQEERGPER